MKVNFLKKIMTVCFSDTPWRIRPFHQLYRQVPGAAVDRPESLSAIMVQQEGEICYYNQPRFLNDKFWVERHLNGLPRFKARGFFKAPDRVVYSISGASILGQMGLVYDPDKRCFIAESTADWTLDLKDLPYTNAYRLSGHEHLPGITLSFLTLGADGGFYHFLLESLVKAGMFAGMMKHADHFLFNGPQTAWKQKWIDRANIDSSKIIWVTNASHYLCDQLLFTNKLIGDQQANQWCVDALRSLMRSEKNIAVKAQQKAIWISRKDANSRTITWEQEVLALYANIQPLDLSEMNTEETILAFQDATHVISPHGAGLSNLYLCSEGTSILELFPEGDSFKPCYQRLAEVCRLQYQAFYLDFKDKTNTDLGIKTLSATLNKFLC
ncbi:glycosyltransferase family 61 protein [Mucilaginibacter sp. HD30]